MANKPFDRVILNDRERPVSRDFNRFQSELDYALREYARQNFAAKSSVGSNLSVVSSGFLGDAFYVQPTSPAGMSVVVRSGLGFQNDPGGGVWDISGILGLDDRSLYKPLILLANQTITGVPAADPALARVDIVEVRYNRAVTDAESRDQLTLATGVFASVPLNKTLSFALDTLWSVNGSAAINYKAGIPGAGTPATDAGYIKIAEIDVPAAATSIPVNRIRDVRQMLWDGGVLRLGLRYVTAAAGVAYSGLTVSGPPGVLVATYNPGPSHAKARVAIIAGAQLTSASAATSSGTTAVGSSAILANLGGLFGSLQMTQIEADKYAGITAPANPVLSIAVGQYYWLAEWDLYRIAVGGTPIVNDVAATFCVNFNMRY